MSLAMSKSERESFLAGLHVGIISVAQPGKGPVTVPIWYDYIPGGDLWVITGRESIKGHLLAKSERFSLCAQTEAPPYRYVSVEGMRSIRPATAEDVLKMSIRYLGPEQGKAYAAAAGDTSSNIVVSMQPEQWLTVDYGKAG